MTVEEGCIRETLAECEDLEDTHVERLYSGLVIGLACTR